VDKLALIVLVPRGRQGQVGMLHASSKPRAEDEDVLALYIIGLYSLYLKDLDEETTDAEPTPGDEGSVGFGFVVSPSHIISQILEVPHNLTNFGRRMP
jgi:hypothetical protein